MTLTIRGMVPPPEIQALAKRLIAAHGARGAARRLGVSRPVLIAAAAGANMLEGTILLLEARARDLLLQDGGQS